MSETSTNSSKPMLLVAEPAGLRLCFEKVGDRFSHSLQRRVEGEWLDLLRSLEGTHEDAWPPSPPLQELVPQEWHPTPCLVGVGKSGSGHWSLSVELREDERGFLFDVACRSSESPEALGSTYQLAASDVWTAQGSDLIGPELLVSSARLQRVAVRSSEGTESKLELEQSIVRWAPGVVESPDLPVTCRWRYEIACVS